MKNVQTIEEILSEFSLFHSGRGRSVRCSDHPDRYRDARAGPNATHLSLLKDAQKLGLDFRCHLGDLVEKQGASVGLLEAADAPLQRIGEGPFFMAEEFAFHQRRRNSGAIQRQKDFFTSGRKIVEGPRHEFFAGPALPAYEHRSVCRSHLA